MKHYARITGTFLLAILLFGCSNRPSGQNVQIDGVYVSERDGEQRGMNSGKVLGKYFIKDTLIISKKEDGYQIENHLWRKYDFDDLGWQRIYHEAIKTYTASFDKTDNTLNAPMSLYPPMILDIEKGILYRNAARTNPYTKIRQ